MSDDFRVETYSENDFDNSLLINESRDKAFEIRQERALDEQKSWTNNTRKYLSKRDTNEQVKSVFADIIQCLEEFSLTNTGKQNLTEISERNKVQAYVTERLGLIRVVSEMFWDEFSKSKDRLSYKFGSRVFPTGDTKWAEAFNDSSRTDKPEVANETGVIKTKEQIRLEVDAMRKATRDLISKQYDINDAGMRNFMDRSFVDEDNNGTFQPLAPAQYYDLLSQSKMEYLFKCLYNNHLYGNMLELWCLAVSCKSFIHHVLKSEYILDLMFNPGLYTHETLDKGKVKLVVQNPFLDEKYREIVYHYLFYGIYILSREECSVKTKATDDMRYSMSISCLAKIPPYEGPLNSNPFMSVTLNDQFLYGLGTPKKNMVIRPLKASMSSRGIYSLDSFKARFNVFTNGIFEGLDFDRLYFTGSLISACAIRNPLEKKFNIDFNKSDDNLFGAGKASVYWNNVKSNLTNYFDEYYPSKNVVKTESISSDQIPDLESLLTDIDCIIDALEDSEFDSVCLRLFSTVKQNIKAKLGREPSRDEVNLIKISTGESYKYQINGRALIRTVELFRIYELRPLGCVSRFHFAPVRGYYNGTDVKVLPSFWCTANTGICQDYKWFSNSKKPQTLICKYNVRGFYMLLNQQEQKSLRKFMFDNPEWSQLDEYSYNPNDDDDSIDPGENREKAVSIMNPIFNPRVSGIGSFYKLREQFGDLLTPAPNCKYIQDTNITNQLEPFESDNKYGIQLKYRFGAGHIKPICLWHVSPYVRDLNRSKKYGLIQ